MSRVINTNSTGSQRQRLRRTIAEALKRLMTKPELDREAKDLASLIVLCLKELETGVEKSATAWDKRHYYIKADRLRAEWDWTRRYSERMGRLIKVQDWVRLPVVLAELVPRFSDVSVVKYTRTPELWNGAHRRLLDLMATEEAKSPANNS